MTTQEAMYFETLSKDRTDTADVFEKPSVSGVKNSVVEKYSDQAHFVYELLQNADDANATKARFILEEGRLIFAHNGTRHFSVSNPNTESEDTKNGTLGDINAITSIANSNKSEASIGKFGVGFKAVFQYTQTPHIYDPSFKFKIERFIVPVILKDDFPDREPDETLFVFPFNHPEKHFEEAYDDIADKLKNLSYPLLFLTNLNRIQFEYNNINGLYKKNIHKTLNLGETVAERLMLTRNVGGELCDEDLWLFSRFDECKRRYSVGFFMDIKGNLKPINEPAFCFFPTREVTNLNFIIHAPFLLTDSREGIRAGIPHNEKMINLLADLSADAIEYLRDIGIEDSRRLIDDEIVEIIPINENDFSDPSDRRKVSFLPFFEAIKEKFKNSELIPTLSGYVTSENAYWAAVPQLTHIFNNFQLSRIVENDSAQWAFASLGRDEVQRNNKALFNYIESLIKSSMDEDAIINGRAGYKRNEANTFEMIKGISEAFIEEQDISWLHRFYKWISETRYRTAIIKDKPIFLDQDGKAVAAYDDEDQLILFLPVKNIYDEYRYINEELLKNEETVAFIQSIGVKEPSVKDQIYNIILPQYENDSDAINIDEHFLIFFNYYRNCSNEEADEFLDFIKPLNFLTHNEGDGEHREKASELYFPSDDLLRYFRSKPSTWFISLDRYQLMIEKEQRESLKNFFIKLGVKKSPSIYEETEGDGYTEVKEYYIDGLYEILNAIEETKDADLSTFLWNQLCAIVDANNIEYTVLKKAVVSRQNGRFSYVTRYNDSSTKNELLEKKWLVNREGSFVTAKEIQKGDLSSIYDVKSESAKRLLLLLEINDVCEEDSNLTESQREKIAFANKCKEFGIGEEDLEDFREYKRQKEARKKQKETEKNTGSGQNQTSLNENLESIASLFGEKAASDKEEIKDDKKSIETSTIEVIKDIVKRTKEEGRKSFDSIENSDIEEVDEDEYMPSTIDYSKKIEHAKQQSAIEIDRITYYEKLQNKAISTKKYSYSWFTTLLDLESINRGENGLRSREISIRFGKVEREPGTMRTLVLKHPNQNIPQFMEELADIPLILHIGDQSKTVAIEVASVQSYTLRVKMKKAESIGDIDLSKVTLATIDTKSPAFLLEELRKRFFELEYEDDFDMQENLSENIEFVFGPPGTGKTTYLAKNVILPIMNNNEECKVLVLTPTNKSADVLTERIMEVSSGDISYNDWLVRFGTTGDEKIEQSPVFKDKTFDIRMLPKSVTITTIARFPYDFFMPGDDRIFLCGINWDYIIVDEASMIPIANIVFPLYKKTPKKFIIAGDPFQIEPITSIDLWKNENIYTLVHLDSFTNPETIPYKYKVNLLTTQYRSIPDIGTIFSNFAYGGILKHYRSADSQRPLNVGNDLGVETLNIIKFPVSKFESIYCPKKLQHSSSYQVYSAIFTFEYVVYLSRTIAENNPDQLFSIGIIAPYRAQADMIDKLLAAEQLPKGVDVQVGTIHGFQGDECDIIFAVLNTPPSISSSKEMFLNRKNIINVSISRARDYLFIVMPDDNTEDINNLKLVKKVEGLIRATDSWNEFLSHDLEDLMFGDPEYLEKNAFSTSHQSVNVYGLPEKKYEVRTEDAAVDVQLHRSAESGDIINQSANSNENKDYMFVEEPKYIDSYDLDENLIPEALRKDAIDLPVKGAISGWYYLVPYDGKLKNYTSKETTVMFVPQIRNGCEKMVSVSVEEEDRIIYISLDMFKLYEQGLSEPEGITIRRNFL